MNVTKLELGTLKIPSFFGDLMETFVPKFVVEQLLTF